MDDAHRLTLVSLEGLGMRLGYIYIRHILHSVTYVYICYIYIQYIEVYSLSKGYAETESSCIDYIVRSSTLHTTYTYLV